MKHVATISALGLAAAVGLSAGAAHAVNNLQLYIEGGTYCTAGMSAADCYPSYTPPPAIQTYNNESWSIGGTVGLRIWVQADSPIKDVKFVASWNDVSGNTPDIVLTGVKIGAPTTPGIVTNLASAYPGITDTTNATTPVTYALNGSLTGLNPLDAGKYTDLTRNWVVVDLGDMLLDETFGVDTKLLSGSGIGTASPTDSPNGAPNGGFQLNVYDITFNISAAIGQVVNFDVWGWTPNQVNCRYNTDGSPKFDYKEGDICYNKDYQNAPNSHDAQWLQTDRITTPEPLTLGVLGAGLVGLAALRRRRR